VYKRIKELPTAIAHNEKITIDEYAKIFDGIEIEKIFVCDNVCCQLPLMAYVNNKTSTHLNSRMNEFFDYLGDDKEIIDIIEKTNDDIFAKKTAGAKALLMFTAYNKALYYILMQFFANRDNSEIYSFITDPVFYTPFMNRASKKYKSLYFGNDSRGTRNFINFPIAELQHLVFDEYERNRIADSASSISFDDEVEASAEISTEKKHDFFFVGTLFYDKGSRIEIWDTFLKDLDIENSHIFIPMKVNGIIYNRGGASDAEKVKERFPEIYERLSNHSMYQGYLKTQELNARIAEYKYGMIFRCISFNDSLNFRVINYLKYDILPFLDPMYDPDYIQIPKKFQSLLRAYDAEDIKNKVEWFNANDEFRLNLLKEMKEYYNIDGFASDWEAAITHAFEQMR
jgi:hypothetical protein